MNRRAFFIAIIVALMGAALLAVYMRRFELEASGGDKIQLLTALKNIEAGTLIRDDMLATRTVPLAYVEDRAIRAKDREKIVGLRMGQGLLAQQTLMWTDLAIAREEQRKLSSLVDPGMRAVTVSATTRGDKSFSLIHPGDRVDVVSTVPDPQNKDKSLSSVLLQNVLILAVGVDTGEGPGDRDREKKELLLSLSIKIQQAQLVALAVEQGKLSVALRNPDDVQVTEGIADVSSNALVDLQQRSQVQGIRKAAPTGPEKIGGDR